MIEFFDELWGQNINDLQKQKNHWDVRAEEFNHYRNQTAPEKIKKLLDYFGQKEITMDNIEILDIGCGNGKFSLEFAKIAKHVIGLDISTQMIQYAHENAKSEGVNNVRFYELPWEEIDLDELKWNQKFDLVVSIMTPAINSRQSLEKMMSASKGYCFMSGYVERYEKVKTEIEQNILQRNPSNASHGRGIYCSFNLLWLQGIYPEITYQYMERENIRTVEEAYTYYCSQLEMKKSLNINEKHAIQKYLEKIACNGRVTDHFQSKTAWLFWNNKEKSRGMIF